MKKAYLVCPVRNRTAADIQFADAYVAKLENDGYRVHYPPRDVDQRDDGIGLRISESHRDAMQTCDEVHIIWDPESRGSHFDFGMAYMLRSFTGVKIVLANDPAITPQRSYGNFIRELHRRDWVEEG